jgi:hypothetical protein
MFLILIACSIHALTFGAHFTWEPGPAEAGFLKEPQDKQGERQWKAGTYRGITVGKSTATVLFQKWGKPKYIGHWEFANPKNPIWFQSAKECEKVPQCRPKKKSVERKRS